MSIKYLDIVIRHKDCSSKFLCYNSFKAKYFWGPKHLSELFALDDKKQLILLKNFPEGKLDYIKSSDSENALCLEYGLK